MNTYNLGANVRIEAVFRNVSDDSLADPTTVIFVISPILAPTPAVSGSWTYGVDVQVVRDSTGTYHMDYLPPPRMQLYSYLILSTGNIYAASDVGEFFVR